MANCTSCGVEDDPANMWQINDADGKMAELMCQECHEDYLEDLAKRS